MHVIGECLRRLWFLFNRRRFDDVLREEMEAHRAVMHDPRGFGNTLRLREDARDVWGWTWIDSLVRDFRFAARVLRRSPGFTFAVIASLAVGLALVTSTMAVANAYLIRALPYAAADRLYHVMYAPPGPWEPRGMATLDWRSVSDVVEFPVTAAGETFYLADGQYAQAARGLRVSDSFVKALGVHAIVGRSLTGQDFNGGSDAAVLGYAVWRDRYGSDPGIVGRYIRTEAETRNGSVESLRIVGVLAPEFYYGRDSRALVDLLVPLTSPARTYMVRLRAGVPRAFAERRITEAARAVTSDLPADWSGVHLEGARERYVAELRPVLIGVLIAAGLVLVVVCTNVSVLTLLRTMRRQKEMAVRAALGSGRWHLARMLMLEALLLCGAALAAGVALTQVALRVLAPLIETHLGRPAPGGTAAIATDTPVLLGAGVIGALIALSLSCLPLLVRWQWKLGDVLRRDRATSSDGRSMRHLRSALVAFEVAGTLVLVVGGGLMIRSVVSMIRSDLGFQPERLVRARVVLRGADYVDPSAFFRFYEQFTDRLSDMNTLPVFSTWPPFVELPMQSVEIDGRSGQGVRAGAVSVGAAYFSTLGIELRSGRDFTRADVQSIEPIAVISETLAKRLWPDGRAVGRQVRAVEETTAGPRPGPWRTVVGVAADVRQTYSEAILSDVYVPLSPSSFGRYGSFYIRVGQPSSSLLETLRTVAAAIDPHAVVDGMSSVESQNRQLAGTKFLTMMLSGFAAVAACLAFLGIYGVTAYTVQQREHEIAIRMALGASGSALVRLLLRDCGYLLGAGLAFGLIGAIAGARLLQSQLYGVQGADVPTLVVTCMLLAATGGMAAWWPARRASLRSPVQALKEG
jgi:putative ABC transport system permease protein